MQISITLVYNIFPRLAFIRAMSFRCQRDSYMQTLNTRVVSCEPSKNGEAECYEAVLEDTILFPEGGGQVLRARLVLRKDVTTFVIPCRPTTVARYSELLESIYILKGETCMIDALMLPATQINGVDVLRVTRRGSKAVHLVRSPLQVDSEALVELDWRRRFDHMQQHTGKRSHWSGRARVLDTRPQANISSPLLPTKSLASKLNPG